MKHETSTSIKRESGASRVSRQTLTIAYNNLVRTFKGSTLLDILNIGSHMMGGTWVRIPVAGWASCGTNSHGPRIARGHRIECRHWLSLLRQCNLRKSSPNNLRVLLLHSLHWRRHSLLSKSSGCWHLLRKRSLHKQIRGKLQSSSKEIGIKLRHGGKLCQHRIRSRA